MASRSRVPVILFALSSFWTFESCRSDPEMVAGVANVRGRVDASAGPLIPPAEQTSSSAEPKAIATMPTEVEQACPCEGAWKSHGEYVSCVAHVTNELKKDHIIAGAEKGSIQS